MQRVDLTSRIPEFVSLAEAKIFRTLRTPEMETKNAAFSITGEYVAVPTGFLEARSFTLNASPYVTLVFKEPDRQSAALINGTGTPTSYSVVGTNFRFSPAPDATYASTLVYFVAPATCSTGAGETNWILTAHPDVYLYGALLEAAAFVGDDPRVPLWAQAHSTAMQQLQKQGSLMRWGGGNMMVRPG